MAQCFNLNQEVDLVEGPRPGTLTCPACDSTLDAATCETVEVA